MHPYVLCPDVMSNYNELQPGGPDGEYDMLCNQMVTIGHDICSQMVCARMQCQTTNCLQPGWPDGEYNMLCNQMVFISRWCLYTDKQGKCVPTTVIALRLN